MTYPKRVPAFVGAALLALGGMRKVGQTPNRNYTEWRTFARVLCMGS